MSVGDTIQCSDLDEAIRRREELITDGYSVDLEYTQEKTVLTIMEAPE